MITAPIDVLTMYPVRKCRRDKKAFREDVRNYANFLGYESTEEKGGWGACNLVIGNPQKARYLVTAHYDTPATLLLPNLLTPCNLLVYVLYQIVIVLLFLAATIIPGVGLGILLDNPEIASLVTMILYWGLLAMMMVGPANRHNANDNTSGVVTVLDIARNLPLEFRDDVCFVLFDLEEAGLIGSSAYRKRHKKEIPGQMIFNCDCVGDGDEIMVFPTKKTKKNRDMMQKLKMIETVSENKMIRVREKGIAICPSDHMNFPYGAGIAAFRRKKYVGLYCDKIHTRKDTTLEEENVMILCRQLMNIICSTAQ